MIALVFHRLLSNPADPDAQQDWANLLDAIEAEHLVLEPMVGSVHNVTAEE